MSKVRNTKDDAEFRRLKAEIGKKGGLTRIRNTDARIAAAIAQLKARGQRLSNANIAEIAGCSARTVTRRLQSDCKLKLVNSIDKNVSSALATLRDTGHPITADAVAAMTGYRPNIVQRRVSLALNHERASA